MEHNRKSGKRVEAFVSWKDRRPVEGRQAGGNARASMGAAKGMKKTNTISVNAVSVPMNRTPGTSEGPSTARSSMKSRDITKKQSRQLGSMEGTEERGEAISAGRVEGGDADSLLRKEVSTVPCGGHSGAAVGVGKRCPIPNVPGNIVNRRSSRNRSPDAGRPTSSSMRFQNVPGGGLAGEQTPHEHLHEKLRGKTLPSAWKQPRGMHQRSTVSSSTRQEVQSNGLNDSDDDLGVDSVDGAEDAQGEAIASHNDTEEQNAVEESEEERDNSEKVLDDSLEDARYMTDTQEIAVSEDSRRRKQRWQAQSMREREADRQIKEGLPRNFLLVDEYTKKPYGVGVGAWRKELMLLSQKLDPAIGNINRHPEGAVQEIADWINNTWEYSAPLRFEYVKEVIARGVTLRRAALWRKIRNGEPKPPTVSDRSWRTLGRQLHSPATIEKAESYRKANASRMNFGRTGPSGEVGVRQRLRRALRRSPDPEEIQEEMA